MLKYSIKIDENVQRELNEKAWIWSLIGLIVGSIGLLAYIVFGVFIESIILDLILWVFAFMFGFGLTFLVTINKTNKRAINRNLTDTVELYEEYMVESMEKNGEVVSTNKYYYKDLTKVKETQNFIFLYVNKMGAVPIPKKSFKSEEVSMIKVWINSSKAKKN